MADAKKQRRKSLSLFGPSGLLGSASRASTTFLDSNGHVRSSSDSIHNAGQQEKTLKRSRAPRPKSSASLLGRSSALNSFPSIGDNNSPRATLTKPPSRNLNRTASSPIADMGNYSLPDEHVPRARSKSFRNSIFGSLRPTSKGEDQNSANARPKDSSGEDDDLAMMFEFGGLHSKPSLGSTVLHYGEVQTTGTMWRKKRSQYLVLTNSHLVRFKNQAKAAETFPAVPSPSGRNTGAALAANRLSVVSLASLQDGAAASHSETAHGIALNRIIGVHKLDDGRPFFSVEVCYMEERSSKVSSLHIQLSDPLEAELWRSGIRDMAEEARTAEPIPFDLETVEYISRTLDHERDYDPYSLSMFRVVRRIPIKQNGRSSIDDNVKLTSTPCYLVIGANKIHLLPIVPKFSNRSSMVSLGDFDMGLSFGIMALTSLHILRNDDAFQLVFRLPLKPPLHLHLSSRASAEIILLIRQRAEFLRPQWLHQPYSLNAPEWLNDQIVTEKVDEDHGAFDRTLVAYCSGYEVNTSNIRYEIDYSCEDAPCFHLLPPDRAKNGRGYNVMELLAVMRALRYNESFRTISFEGVNLDILQDLRDPYGIDFDAMRTRSNVSFDIPGQETISVLSQEIRALALKSQTLKRLNFAFCLTRVPLSGKDAVDPGCGVPEAIFPLCRRRLTKVDWVVLNGIKLGDTDLDYLVDAASQKASQLRALEIGHCGISIHDLDLILSTMTAQEATLEVINISGVQGRLSAELFQQQIGYFAHIRKVDLSHISRSTGPEPLIAPETLMNWELEELSLSNTAVNERTVDSIAAYLHSEKSRKLRVLRLNQCGLTGQDVAVFLYFTVDEGQPRDLHLHVSENRLHVDYSLLFDSIAKNKTPTHLTMRMVDFQKEDHFRQLVEALRQNTTLKYLDLSKASLPYDASPETCKALQRMFEENATIEELDISGEYAHLDVARFGIGLNLALTGLKKNKSLKVLHIEHQKLGLQGANTLASVIEENDTLVEVYCENNEINLQSFTVLVNGLQHNRTITNLPCMARDREHSLDKVRREIEMVNKQDRRHSVSSMGSFRRTIKATMGTSKGGSHKLTKQTRPRKGSHGDVFSTIQAQSAASGSGTSSQPASPEVQNILRSLNSKWDAEVERLQRYLYRNYTLAHGIPNAVDADGNAVGDLVGGHDNQTATENPDAVPNDISFDAMDKQPAPERQFNAPDEFKISFENTDTPDTSSTSPRMQDQAPSSNFLSVSDTHSAPSPNQPRPLSTRADDSFQSGVSGSTLSGGPSSSSGTANSPRSESLETRFKLNGASWSSRAMRTRSRKYADRTKAERNEKEPGSKASPNPPKPKVEQKWQLPELDFS